MFYAPVKNCSLFGLSVVAARIGRRQRSGTGGEACGSRCAGRRRNASANRTRGRYSFCASAGTQQH